MVLYYLLLASCIYRWYSSICYCITAYPYGTALYSTDPLPIPIVLYYLLHDPCLSLRYSTILYWLPVYPFDTLLSSTGSLTIWYSTTFYWLAAYTYGTLHILLAHCISLWYSTILYWLHAYPNDNLLYSIGSLPIPMILYYLLQAHYLCSTGSLSIPMILYYLLLAHCLYPWYSTIFYWSLHIPKNSTIFYWLPAYPYVILLSSTGSLPIPMILYYLLLDHGLSL